MNNRPTSVAIVVFASVLLLARAGHSLDPISVQNEKANLPGHAIKEWVENGYRFIVNPEDSAGTGAIGKLISPNSQLLLETHVGPALDKESILPFNPTGEGIFLAGYPDLIAASATSCGNKCTYHVTFYRASKTSASKVGTFETYADVGKPQDLAHDGFPVIVKIEVFYGLWGGGWNSPGAPAVFALDKTKGQYRHAEKRFYQAWLEEEKRLETSASGPRERELSHHFFLAIDSLLKHDETLARDEYVKAEHLARELYPEVTMPAADRSWGRLVTDVGPWMQPAGGSR